MQSIISSHFVLRTCIESIALANGENSVLYIKHYELTVASFHEFDDYIQYEKGSCFP